MARALFCTYFPKLKISTLPWKQKLLYLGLSCRKMFGVSFPALFWMPHEQPAFLVAALFLYWAVNWLSPVINSPWLGHTFAIQIIFICLWCTQGRCWKSAAGQDLLGLKVEKFLHSPAKKRVYGRYSRSRFLMVTVSNREHSNRVNVFRPLPEE